MLELRQKLYKQYGVESSEPHDMTDLNNNLALYRKRIEESEFMLDEGDPSANEIQYTAAEKTSIAEEISQR